jgi:hypothetical protein
VPSFETKFLKKRFSPYELECMGDREAPCLSYFDKVKQGGKSVAEAVILKGPNGNSGDFQTAQGIGQDGPYTYQFKGTGTAITIQNTGLGASNYDEFDSPYGQYHGVATITAFAKAAGQTNPDAYLRQLDEIMSSEISSFLSVGARKILGPIGGSIGQVTVINAGAVAGNYTLARPTDAYNFAVGMVLMFATTDGSSAPGTVRGGTSPTVAYVVGVTPDADSTAFPGGHIQVSLSVSPAAAAAITGVANNDFIFRAGDVQQSTDLSDRQIRSLQTWVTLATSTSTLFNVARAQDARLSGFRVPSASVAGLSMLDRAQLLATTGRAFAKAKDANVLVLGPQATQQMTSEAQSYGQLKFAKNEKLGIDVPVIITQNGETQICCEPHAVSNDMWLWTPKNLKMYHTDGFPALDTGDGNEILRMASQAGYEVRWHAFTCITVNGKPWTFGRTDTGITA